MFDELGIYWALPILNDAQHEVSIWLVANSIKNLPQRCEIGMDVESHNEGFKLKYGRYPRWDEEEPSEESLEPTAHFPWGPKR